MGLGSKGIKKKSYLISTPNHSLLSLHLHILLLLSIGQRPRDTKQESTGTDDPQSSAAEHHTGLCERADPRDGGGESEAGRRRNHVSESCKTVGEGLALEFNFGFIGNFGFWGVLGKAMLVLMVVLCGYRCAGLHGFLLCVRV